MYRKIMGFLEAWKESEHRNFCILYLSELKKPLSNTNIRDIAKLKVEILRSFVEHEACEVHRFCQPFL